MKVSRIYWIFGIGWPTTIALAFLYYFSLLTTGLTYIVVGVVFWLFVIFSLYRMYRWNGSKWRRMHSRGMLIYAHFAGSEAANAANEKREFNVDNACRQLLYFFINNHDYETANEMLRSMQEEQGMLYYHLLDGNIKYVLPNLSNEQINSILDSVHKVRIGPQMAIMCLILNLHGEVEATRYVISLMKGKAS